jgi:4-hydroxy-tetrahydrodipicolinate synthase
MICSVVETGDPMPAIDIPRPLRGVIPPMITPLSDPATLDVAGLERLVEHILGAGANGLFILGTTGEAPALAPRLRREVVERTCRQVAGRVPVLVGITDPSFSASLDLSAEAAGAGAQAVVVAPPYYFAATQAELLHYLEELVERLPLPLFLYNAPSYVHHWWEPETVRRAAEFPGVLGLKDSSSNMIYFHTLRSLLKGRTDFTLLVGPEELMAEAVLLGGHGGMCGGANFWPQLYVGLYRAAAAGQLAEVNRLQETVMFIRANIYNILPEESSYLRALKCAVSLMGVCGDSMSEPFNALDKSERERIQQHLIIAGALPAPVRAS